MSVSAVHALGSHPARNRSCIGRESSDGDTNVIVDGEDLLLVRGEVGGGSLERDQHRVSVALETHGG